MFSVKLRCCRCWLLVPVLLLSLPGLRAASANDPAGRMETLLAKTFPAHLPGAAVIVVKDGKVLFRQARGMANLELNVPLQPDMLFRLGSITKQFTAAAIMLLAEQGKLSLQDPLTKFLPDYPVKGRLITVEHLLTHTSGIQSYTDMPGWMTGKIRNEMTLTELIDGFKNEPMQFLPGEKFRYNNSGYILLGAIIEKASGESYEQYLRQNIFTPLGMTSTCYGHNEPVISKRVTGYSGPAGSPVNAAYLSMTQPHAAGSLLSTLDDLARWDAALYTGKLLPAAALAKMWTPYQPKDGSAPGYGYGFSTGTLKGRPVIEHGGGIFGFSTYGLRLPGEKVYVAVLCNSDNPAAAPSFLAKKLAALAMGDPFPEPVFIELAPAQLEKYQGVYQIGPEVQRTVTVENGKLYTRRTGGARQEARPVSADEFYYENNFSHFRFVLDAQGRVTEMLMYQEGRTEPERAAKTAELPPVRKAAAADPALYTQFVGRYELTPGFILTVTREENRLFLQATGQDKFELFPETELKYFLQEVDARVTFVKDAAGKVNLLMLHQHGQNMPAKRIQ